MPKLRSQPEGFEKLAGALCVKLGHTGKHDPVETEGATLSPPTQTLAPSAHCGLRHPQEFCLRFPIDESIKLSSRSVKGARTALAVVQLGETASVRRNVQR